VFGDCQPLKRFEPMRKKYAALPPNVAPRLLGREASAAYIDLTPNTFDAMVEAGTMPKARILTKGRKAWDMRELDAAVDRLPYDGGEVLEHGWT
jgi:hypothetical protein